MPRKGCAEEIPKMVHRPDRRRTRKHQAMAISDLYKPDMGQSAFLQCRFQLMRWAMRLRI